MAILNSRVLELIETLVAARLDWLAFELIEGIRLGRTAEEFEEALAAARQSIRNDAQPKARGEPQVLLAKPEPIPAGEQVEWAAAYVEERLETALEQLQASIDALDLIVESTNEPEGPQTWRKRHPPKPSRARHWSSLMSKATGKAVARMSLVPATTSPPCGRLWRSGLRARAVR